MDGRRCGQIAEHQAEGMIGSDLIVPVGDDEEGAQATDAAAEEAEELERGAVGPVSVLADDDGRLRPGGEGGEHGPQELFAGVAFGSRAGRSADRARAPDRAQARAAPGVERASHEVRSTVAVPGNLAAELIDERGLADPGFAANKDQAALAPRRPGAGAR